MHNILIVYAATRYPLRATIKDHLYSFEHYSEHRCFYLNLAVRGVPFYFQYVKFDLIIFHTTLLSRRTELKDLAKKAEKLDKFDAIKIALPQDEFYYTGVLNEFINRARIDTIFSVAPKSEWPVIYADVDLTKVNIYRVLTGYLDDSTVSRVVALTKQFSNRPIDIGYRTKPGRFWLGRHGYLKGAIGAVFQKRATRFGLVTDISTDEADTFLGDDWYKFLLKCRYTIGIEGGASIHDRDGSIKTIVESYLVDHPNATFQEVEEHCFSEIDGKFKLFAISPRHLEACITKTCQILVEGDYNDILKPNVHYIPLKPDFSNVDQVLARLGDENTRRQIVETAFRDIVVSGEFTYEQFVEFVLRKSLPQTVYEHIIRVSFLSGVLHFWAQLAEQIVYMWVVALNFSAKLLQKLIPRQIIQLAYRRVFKKLIRGI